MSLKLHGEHEVARRDPLTVADEDQFAPLVLKRVAQGTRLGVEGGELLRELPASCLRSASAMIQGHLRGPEVLDVTPVFALGFGQQVMRRMTASESVVRAVVVRAPVPVVLVAVSTWKKSNSNTRCSRPPVRATCCHR